MWWNFPGIGARLGFATVSDDSAKGAPRRRESHLEYFDGADFAILNEMDSGTWLISGAGENDASVTGDKIVRIEKP